MSKAITLNVENTQMKHEQTPTVDVPADPYWMRLMAAFVEYQRPGHLSGIYPDEALRRQLEETVEGEPDYAPPAMPTRDVRLGEGGESFTVRVYTPEAGESPRPLFVWVHGGGWAFGDLDSAEADATSREVAARAGAIVVSVDYRLAREGLHYPAPLDDVVTAYRWAVAQADELGADRSRITLGGASAGGNLVAGAVLRLIEDGEQVPTSLVLAYSALHAVLPVASAELQGCLDRISVAAGFGAEIYRPIVENYLGGAAESAPSQAMAGVADDLSGFPPSYIFNCEFDGLRASGEEFAKRLRQAGVAVVLETIPGVAHGHLSRPGLPQSRQSFEDLAAWVGAQR